MSVIERAEDKPLIASLVYDLNKRTQYGITFYIGQIIYIDDTSIDVTFVSYPNLETAKYAFRRCAGLNHTHVARSWSLSEDACLHTHFVSYTRFDCFLEHHNAFAWYGPSTVPDSLPGNPAVWIQVLVKGLIDAIMYLHDKKVSCRYFDLPQCYVMRGTDVQIFLVDQLIDSYTCTDPKKTQHFHDLVKNQGIAHFGLILGKFIILNGTGMDWPQRDNFLSCFDSSADPPRDIPMSPRKRLEMVRTHPLVIGLQEVLEIICRTDRALDNLFLIGHDVASIRRILMIPKVFELICPHTSTNKWKVMTHDWCVGLNTPFKTYITERKKELKSQGIVCKVRQDSLLDLISWNRNAHDDQRVHPVDIYDNVHRLWPTLPSVLHRVTYTYAD